MLSRPLFLSVKGCVRCLEEAFNKAGVDEAKHSAQFIAAAALGKKTFRDVHPSAGVNEYTWQRIHQMAARRLTHEPIQYVIGQRNFRFLCLDMRAPVLIPRRETEELVGHILEELAEVQKASFLEIGSGSGAIALSLLHEHAGLTGTAIDISDKACQLTVQNARKYDLQDRLHVRHMGLQEYIDSKEDERFDLVVSNPPYLCTEDMASLHPQVREFEDEIALHGGKDGLDLVNVILHNAPGLLKSQGSLWLKVDSKQPAGIERYVNTSMPQLSYLRTIRDLRKVPRFCHLQLDEKDD